MEHAMTVTSQQSVTYTVVLTPDEDGWICAQVLEVPEAISQGRTLEEAKANVTEALEAALAWRADEGQELPASGQVAITSVTVQRP
jgi:antitoxin HicB